MPLWSVWKLNPCYSIMFYLAHVYIIHPVLFLMFIPVYIMHKMLYEFCFVLIYVCMFISLDRQPKDFCSDRGLYNVIDTLALLITVTAYIILSLVIEYFYLLYDSTPRLKKKLRLRADEALSWITSKVLR